MYIYIYIYLFIHFCNIAIFNGYIISWLLSLDPALDVRPIDFTSVSYRVPFLMMCIVRKESHSHSHLSRQIRHFLYNLQIQEVKIVGHTSTAIMLPHDFNGNFRILKRRYCTV